MFYFLCCHGNLGFEFVTYKAQKIARIIQSTGPKLQVSIKEPIYMTTSPTSRAFLTCNAPANQTDIFGSRRCWSKLQIKLSQISLIILLVDILDSQISSSSNSKFTLSGMMIWVLDLNGTGCLELSESRQGQTDPNPSIPTRLPFRTWFYSAGPFDHSRFSKGHCIGYLSIV